MVGRRRARLKGGVEIFILDFWRLESCGRLEIKRHFWGVSSRRNRSSRAGAIVKSSLYGKR